MELLFSDEVDGGALWVCRGDFDDSWLFLVGDGLTVCFGFSFNGDWFLFFLFFIFFSSSSSLSEEDVHDSDEEDDDDDDDLLFWSRGLLLLLVMLAAFLALGTFVFKRRFLIGSPIISKTLTV